MSQSTMLPNFCSNIKNKDAAKNKPQNNSEKQNSNQKKSLSLSQASLVNHINNNSFNNREILVNVARVLQAKQSKNDDNNNDLTDDNNNNNDNMYDAMEKAQTACKLLALQFLTTCQESIEPCELQMVRSHTQGVIDHTDQIDQAYKDELFQFLLFDLDLVFAAIDKNSDKDVIDTTPEAYKKCQELGMQIVNNDKNDKTYAKYVAIMSEICKGYIGQIRSMKQASELYIDYIKKQNENDSENSEKECKDAVIFMANIFATFFSNILHLETNKKKVVLKFQEYHGIGAQTDEMSEEEDISMNNDANNNNDNNNHSSNEDDDNFDGDRNDIDDYESQEQDDDIRIDNGNSNESDGADNDTNE